MAHLTNFSFEFSYENFTEDASQRFIYHGAKTKKNDQKLKSRGSCLKHIFFFHFILEAQPTVDKRVNYGVLWLCGYLYSAHVWLTFQRHCTAIVLVPTQSSKLTTILLQHLMGDHGHAMNSCHTGNLQENGHWHKMRKVKDHHSNMY